MTPSRPVMTARLTDLERTVDALNGQLRDMQLKLQRAKAGFLPKRFWNHLMTSRQGNEFMSAVCNRRVRPNTKVIHVGTLRH